MSDELLRYHHDCNVWCRGEMHCDTFYTSTNRIATLVPYLEAKAGITVMAIESASEAPPLDLDKYVSLVGHETESKARYAMLVRWTFSEKE